MTRKMIAVAVVSALLGAGVALWAKSAVMATGAQAESASVRISPSEIAPAASSLPVELFEGLQ